MRDYVIINGVSSERIRGLLIQQLPPITKPKMRTQVETVDGRDGDIVTKLGFSAYDKEILIGLYGQYDVDEIIAFFAASGTIVFSNEPQKYYRFEQLEGVDYEKLIRWKQAKVKFHVQPFKYSTIEKELEFDTTALITSETGNVVSFADERGGNDLRNVLVDIMPNMAWSGDPSPTNIRAISGWSGVNVSAAGKNIFDYAHASWVNGYTIAADGTITASDGYRYTEAYTKVEPNATYTGQLNVVTTNSRSYLAAFYDADKNFISRSTIVSYTVISAGTGVKSGTITTPPNCMFMRLISPISGMSDYQVEKGSVASEYEAFGSIVSASWEPVVYAGEADLTNGVLTVTHAIKTFDGTESFSGSDGRWWTLLSDAIAPNSRGAESTGWCSHYKVVTDVTSSTLADKQCAYSNNLLSTAKRAFFQDSSYSDAASFKAYVAAQYAAETPLQLVYRLETPLTYQFDPIVVETHKGMNNISADAGDITVTRYSKNEVNVMNAGNYISKPIITVEGSGTAWIYINGSQIFQINLEEPVTINTEEMNAYRGTLLANRSVKGDYEKAYLSAGLNEVGWNGDVSKIIIRNYSRWY